MRKTTLLLLIAGLSLTACNKNPLEKHDPQELAQWIYQKKTPALEQCGQLWADQSTANETVLENCESTAKSLATIMSEAGFGDIKPDHVKLPILWMAFNDRVRMANRDRYDPAKAAEAMRLPTKEESANWKKRIEEAKKARAKKQPIK